MLFLHLWRGKSREKHSKHLPHLILTLSAGQTLSKPSPVQPQRRIKPQVMPKQFQLMETSSRKGLDTTSGNTDPDFLQNTCKSWPRTSDVAKEPEPVMAAGIPACGEWAKYLCLLIFNSSDYPRVLRSPNVCLTGSVCLFKINLCNGNVQPGVWVGSAEWRAGDGRKPSSAIPHTLHAQQTKRHSVFIFCSIIFNECKLFFFPSSPFNFKLV